MTPQSYEDVREIPLTTDEQVLTRVQDLIQHSLRRQIWLMFLDEEHRQLPFLMPSYVPRHPEPGAEGPFGEFLGSLFDEVDASSMVIIFERIGSDTLSEGDREWFRLIHAACLTEEIPLRGPILAHDGGVRWIATEDYLM
jgi:hypothetical protein